MRSKSDRLKVYGIRRLLAEVGETCPVLATLPVEIVNLGSAYAGVGYRNGKEGQRGELRLFLDPSFFRLNDFRQRYVLYHEALHLIFSHLTTTIRLRNDIDRQLWALCTDVVINAWLDRLVYNDLLTNAQSPKGLIGISTLCNLPLNASARKIISKKWHLMTSEQLFETVREGLIRRQDIEEEVAARAKQTGHGHLPEGWRHNSEAKAEGGEVSGEEREGQGEGGKQGEKQEGQGQGQGQGEGEGQGEKQEGQEQGQGEGEGRGEKQEGQEQGQGEGEDNEDKQGQGIGNSPGSGLSSFPLIGPSRIAQEVVRRIIRMRSPSRSGIEVAADQICKWLDHEYREYAVVRLRKDRRRGTYPSIIRRGRPSASIILDTSGSVADSWIRLALDLCKRLYEQGWKLFIHQGDTRLRGSESYEEIRKQEEFEVAGRGGTRLGTVFHQVIKQDPARYFIFITDGENCDWPKDTGIPPRKLCWVLMYTGKLGFYQKTALTEMPKSGKMVMVDVTE